MVEEATEDAYRIAAVAPLKEDYLKTPLITLSRKRAIWLTLLLLGALFTAATLNSFRSDTNSFPWLVLFLPLVISTGGNSGSQSATLVITALSTGNITLTDWWRVVRRELAMGLLLGTFLGIIAYGCALWWVPGYLTAAVIPLTLVLVVLCGTLIGSSLPLLFHGLGLDPAFMSNPFVASLMDVVGTLIYMSVAVLVLT